MSKKEIVDSIEKLCENLTPDKLPTLQSYFEALGADYFEELAKDSRSIFLEHILSDSYRYKYEGFNSRADFQIAVLKAAIDAGWPLFDTKFDFAISIAYTVALSIAYTDEDNHKIEAAKLYEFMLDNGFDGNAKFMDEPDGETITDIIRSYISSSIVIDGEPPAKIMRLVPAYEVLRAHEEKLPYHGLESYDSVQGRTLKAVYAKQAQPNGTSTFLENQTDWCWSDELVFDFDGKLLVYDTDVWVNPHVLNNEPDAWINVSDSFKENIGHRLQQLSFQLVRVEDNSNHNNNYLATTFDFYSARSLTAIGTDDNKLLFFKRWIAFKDSIYKTT